MRRAAARGMYMSTNADDVRDVAVLIEIPAVPDPRPLDLLPASRNGSGAWRDRSRARDAGASCRGLSFALMSNPWPLTGSRAGRQRRGPRSCRARNRPPSNLGDSTGEYETKARASGEARVRGHDPPGQGPHQQRRPLPGRPARQVDVGLQDQPARRRQHALLRGGGLPDGRRRRHGGGRRRGDAPARWRSSASRRSS